MAVQTDRTDADMHKLDQNILLFVRLLRAVGLKVGPSAMLDSLRSVQLVGLHNKAYFYYALSVSLLNRPEDRVLFDQAFHLFWRNPKFMEQMRNMLLPQMKSIGGQAEKDMIRRLENALGKSDEQDKQASENTEIEID
ncbi:MAG: VWA domain-containing protein, partial [Alphaproteobacteria bacterium]|nr:VWA domain-containing protein [Alphaproteobacteria bacterium]